MPMTDVHFEFNNNHVSSIFPQHDIMFCPDMKLQVNKFYYLDPQNCRVIEEISQKKFFNENSNSVFMRVEDENFKSISYLNDRCTTDSNWLWILLIVFCIVVLCSILVFVIFCFIRRRRTMDIIMPEPRTYRQTQIVMQVETHGLIKTDF